MIRNVICCLAAACALTSSAQAAPMNAAGLPGLQDDAG
jgi:hypothetical protein